MDLIGDDTKSFYEYCIEQGYYFDYKILESFLLSLKVNPFILLVGNSGSGKSSLPKLFSSYLSKKRKKEDIFVYSVNSLGKAHSNKEWHLKRDTISEVLPIMPFEGKECKFTINDSFTSAGKFSLDPRFKFYDKRLINHLLKLREEDPNQDVNLKIKVGERTVDSSYMSIYDIKYELRLFKKQNSSDNNFSLIGKLLKNSNKHKDINYFLIVENITRDAENDMLELLNILKENILYNNCYVIGTINIGELNQDLSVMFLDNFNILEMGHYNLEEYVYGKFDKYPVFKDLEYLEFSLYDDISKFSMIEIKNIFNDVYSNNDKVIDLIFKELSLINGIFLKNGRELGLRTVNDILKFILISWKYEGEPNTWNNWEKYFDFQFKQKILPKIKNQPIYSDFINDLLLVCGKFDIDVGNVKEDIKYYESYQKLNDMKNSLNFPNFSFFNTLGSFTDLQSVGEDVSSNNKIKPISKSKKNNFNTPKPKNKENKSKYGSNIYKYGEFFVINKQIKRKHVNFGKFDSLSEATFVKNILVENNWKLSRIRNKDCIYLNNGCYWIIKVLGDKLVLLGKFNSYESANEHISWLVDEFKNNGDFKVYIPKKQSGDDSSKNEIIMDLNGWKKLVFNAVNELEMTVFSLNDLKTLDLFQIYEFEDQSLEEIILENLNKLTDLGLIECLSNNYYKKV